MFQCETRLCAKSKVARMAATAVLACIMVTFLSVVNVFSQQSPLKNRSEAGRGGFWNSVNQGWSQARAFPKTDFPADSEHYDKHIAGFLVLIEGSVVEAMRSVELLRGSVLDGLPPVNLGVCVRPPGSNEPHPQNPQALNALSWRHGSLTVVLQQDQLSKPHRLAKCMDKLGWSRASAATGPRPTKVGAESVLVTISNVNELSRHWAQWLVRAVSQYRSSRYLRAFSLLQLPKTADASLTLGSLTIAHKLSSFSGMATFLSTWQAYIVWVEAGHGSDFSVGVSTFNAFCAERNMSTVHSNLGERLTWMKTKSNVGGNIEVVPFWRREYETFPSRPLGVDHQAGTQVWRAAASIIEANTLKMALFKATPPRDNSFAGLVIINAAFVDMTLSWLCNTASMPGVHERSVLVCTDQECLFRMRTSTVAARVSAVLGLNLFLRTTHVPGADAVRNVEREAGALRYASVHYNLMMIARQALLADLALSGVPYLLFETDALWADDAYSWLDRALASGKVWDRQRKEGRPADLPAFDFVGYVDGGARDIGGGFFLTFATPEARALVSLWDTMMQTEIRKIKDISAHHAGMHIDQRTLKHVFNLFDANGSVAIFPPPSFPPGSWYMSRNTSEGDLAHVVSEGIVVLQFNWVAGVQAKIDRAIKYGHWFLEEGCVCNETAAAILASARAPKRTNEYPRGKAGDRQLRKEGLPDQR